MKNTKLNDIQVYQDIEEYREYLHGVGQTAPSGYVPQVSAMLDEHLDGYDRYRAAMNKYPRKWYRRKNGV